MAGGNVFAERVAKKAFFKGMVSGEISGYEKVKSKLGRSLIGPRSKNLPLPQSSRCGEWQLCGLRLQKLESQLKVRFGPISLDNARLLRMPHELVSRSCHAETSA